jgi:hypothetical protein
VFAFFEAGRETDVAFGVGTVASWGDEEVLGCWRSTIPPFGFAISAVGVEQLTVVTRIRSVDKVALQAKRRLSRPRRSTSTPFSILVQS